MSEAEGRVLETSVHKYKDTGLWHRIRQAWATRHLGHRGVGVQVERNVRFLRHPENVFLGDHVLLKEGVRICPTNPSARIRIGDHASIGYHVFLFAARSIEIGAHTMVAPFCYFVDSTHGVLRQQLMRTQPMIAAPIVIGEDVWIGVGVTLLKGVTIGRGAVISAGSVVSKDVPDYAICRGNPVEIMGYRA